jgi:hypothetical protein
MAFFSIEVLPKTTIDDGNGVEWVVTRWLRCTLGVSKVTEECTRSIRYDSEVTEVSQRFLRYG